LYKYINSLGYIVYENVQNKTEKLLKILWLRSENVSKIVNTSFKTFIAMVIWNFCTPKVIWLWWFYIFLNQKSFQNTFPRKMVIGFPSNNTIHDFEKKKLSYQWNLVIIILLIVLCLFTGNFLFIYGHKDTPHIYIRSPYYTTGVFDNNGCSLSFQMHTNVSVPSQVSIMLKTENYTSLIQDNVENNSPV